MDSTAEYYSTIRRAFEKMAPYYDWMALPAVRMRNTVVRVTAAPPGSTILDVATGTGAQALAFDRRGAQVTGIALSEAMLAVARSKNKSENLRFETGDATQLPYPSGSFDVTTISFALHDMPLDIGESVLKEMVRVTRPTGTIVIADYALPRSRIGSLLIYRVVTLYEQQYYREFIRRDVRAILKQAGIEIGEEKPAVLGAVRIWKGGIHTKP